MEQVEPRMNTRLDLDGLAFELEVAVQCAAPHVERLASRLQIGELHGSAGLGQQMQGDAAQRETMRILSQPLDLRTLRLGPVAQPRKLPRLPANVDGFEAVLVLELLGIGEAVPGPLRLREQW